MAGTRSPDPVQPACTMWPQNIGIVDYVLPKERNVKELAIWHV